MFCWSWQVQSLVGGIDRFGVQNEKANTDGCTVDD